jgi:hypothetical protein|tara:strand:+ start:261 stop:554 length:294 start_codon:yes stop_codon:yes gene_type:complete
MAEWVWYESKLARVESRDPGSDFCVINILRQTSVDFFTLEPQPVIVSSGDIRDCVEHEISEIRENVFLVDGGDEDYLPSSSSSSESCDDLVDENELE